MVSWDRMRRAAGECGHEPKEQIVDGLTVTLIVVTSRTEAELVAGLLRSNGLRAAVSADDAGGQDPQLQLEGVRVLVAPSDEAAARRILAEAEAAGS
jgi:formate dehydrogenase assembly factor FdhD